MSQFDRDTLLIMLERTGGALHSVDGEDLFCRVKDLGVSPDAPRDLVMVERRELTHIAGDSFPRRAHHDTDVDGVTWSIVAVREKLSGLVVWTMEREIG